MTIQVRLCPSDGDWAHARNAASEQLKAIKDSALSGTFLDFALVVKQLGIQQVSEGVDQKLRFNSALYNPSMHRAAQGILSLMDTGKEFKEAMRQLDLHWGRDLLANAYSKLNRLYSISKSAASAGHIAESRAHVEVAGWLVDMLDLALKLNLTTPSKATEVWLLGDRNHKTAGYWQACLVAMEAAGFV